MRGSSGKASQDQARRTEKELRDVIETIPAMAFSIRPDGSTEFVNQRVLEYTGLSAETISGSGWQSTVHVDDFERHMNKWNASLSSGEPFENEVRHRSAKGEYRWFLIRAIPLRDERGNLLKWYGILTDIEDRKRAESLLAGEKRILEMVAKGDSLPEILDSLSRLVQEQADGVRASVLLLDGDRLRHGGAPSLPKAYTDAIDGAVIGPSAGSCGTAAYRGKQVIVEDIASDPLWVNYRDLALPHSLRACWSTPVFSSQGKVIATFAMYYREPRRPSLHDQEIIEQITHLAGVAIEQKVIQEKLRRSEAYLAEAQRLTQTGSFVWDAKTRQALYLSDEWYRIYGFDPRKDGRAWEERLERFHAEDRSKWQTAVDRAIHEKCDYEVEYRVLVPGGITKYLHVIGHPVLNTSGDVAQFLGTVTDITERKRAEEALRRSEGYLAEAQRLSHTGSWAWTPSTGQIGYWSGECFRVLGFDPLGGPPRLETFFERIHPDDQAVTREIIENAIRQKADFEWECRIVRHGGEVRDIHLAGHPVLSLTGGLTEFIGTVIDVTERKRAEAERERLRQLEANLAHIHRVSMMGELAASLAHEIKQPITAAATNARTSLRWLQREPPQIEEARECALRVVNNVNRAADIINRVRSLYTGGVHTRELLDVNEIIEEMVDLLRDEACRYSIPIHRSLDKNVPKIIADRVQLQQVFMNLMLNGIDAMKDTAGELKINSERTDDGKVLISVSDTGVGLLSEKVDEIFSAFFTTKPQGTGMGLAITRSIIEAHGGHLWATANSGRGATFHFTLPIETAGPANPACETSETAKGPTTADPKLSPPGLSAMTGVKQSEDT